jgi:hypothetical protein
MFDRFRTHYGQARGTEGRQPWLCENLIAVDGYQEFAREFAGGAFAGGLYRVHDSETGPQGEAAIAEVFADFEKRAIPFAFDWLGRQFAIDLARTEAGQPSILLMDPGAGEALEIPEDFVGLHERELVDYADAALAEQFFGEWKGDHRDQPPLQRGECVAYKIPLFLGGLDGLENVELSDLNVYWSMCGQLRRGTAHLAHGTPIDRVAGQ